MNTYFLEHLLDPAQSVKALEPCVLTIGNFDGVHLGHQAMLKAVRENAQAEQLQSAVMIFEPQPREFFDPNNAPARLTNFAEKQAILSQMGIDTLIVASFDGKFRSLSAKAFADILVKTLNVKTLVLGDDFRFGQDRIGDSQFLRDYGLPVTNLTTITDNSSEKVRISSTRIRELLLSGDIERANHLLGRDYSISGVVQDGDKIGRTLDFPTANISLDRLTPALHGIFAVDVVRLDEDGKVITDGLTNLAKDGQTGIQGLRAHSLFGTANIGKRPSVDKPHEWRLEVFFPEFSGDLYGLRLNVRFLHFLHGERRYDSLAALKAGIQQDVQDLLAWRRDQR